MRKFTSRLIAAVLSVLAVPAWAGVCAADWQFQSSERQARLVQLFTSQGCSSCPPADRWLSSLDQEDGLWTDIVPVAFHVDYWDRLGWPDEFASAAHSARQRQLARYAGSGVYTPGVFVQNQEWRDWRRGRLPRVNPDPVGVLQVSQSAGAVQINFRPASDIGRGYRAHVVPLTLSAETQVLAGENRGRSLREKFIAGDVGSVALRRAGEAWHGSLTCDEMIKGDGVAIWLDDQQGNYIQAVGAAIGGR